MDNPVCLMIIGPGLSTILRSSYIRRKYGNRQLAEKPALTRDNLHNYASQYNSYYNDHLAFRSQMIEANSILNMKLFGDSSSASVVLGKNDWLFLQMREVLRIIRERTCTPRNSWM